MKDGSIQKVAGAGTFIICAFLTLKLTGSNLIESFILSLMAWGIFKLVTSKKMKL
ncbi:hypothetical protein [Virgibacillus dokdonensis]|uniref:hypothetical protein n=1 Tax=Virgibacillus dokdonensis TaxID=302167 RepID=UPI0015F2808D|nr:hypothetical protein [Virgibacillus dokdonensis]